MRPGAPLRSIVACAGLTLGVGTVRSDGPQHPDASVAGLESPSFETRRVAEKTIFENGASVLAALALGDADVDARIAAFDGLLAACEDGRSPTAARAAARIASRLEASATDDQVRRIPRLLRIRLDRVLPLVVVDRAAPVDRTGPRIDGHAARGLLPEAHAILLDRVQTTDDPRVLAGALTTLCSEDGRGVEDDADLDVIGDAWAKNPARFDALGRFDSADGDPPFAAVELALALTGRAAGIERLARAVDQTTWSLRVWIEPRLNARKQRDLAMGTFLVDLEEGRASATVEASAARKALDASIPWLARLLARRAMFLDPASAEGASVLKAASDAVGLHSPERRDGRLVPDSTPAGAAPVDDAEAVAIDEALRAGSMSQRLVCRIEAGRDGSSGLLSAALVDGRLFHATARGGVRVDDTTGARAPYTFGREALRGTSSIAIRGDEVAVVDKFGDVSIWPVDHPGEKPLRTEPLSASAVAAGAKGFFVAGLGLRISRVSKDGIEKFDKIAPVDQLVVRTLAVFPDDTLLVASAERAWRIDPVTGRSTPLTLSQRATIAVAVCGDDVLSAFGSGYARVDRQGRHLVGGRLPDGARIQGLASERDGSTVYLQASDSLYAVDPANGHIRWVEPVEGGGDPVVGDGLVVARAGGGGYGLGGDGREDRTFSVLRTTTSSKSPFGAPERERLVALATALAAEGNQELVRALVDPILGWLSADEREAIERAALASLRGRVQLPPPDEHK